MQSLRKDVEVALRVLTKFEMAANTSHLFNDVEQAPMVLS